MNINRGESQMNIVFMGTPDFAVPCLRALIEEGHHISLVVTQADKPKGRGHRLTSPPVKELALTHELPIYQPVSLKTDEAVEIISAAAPQVIVVVAYGKILPQAILSLPPMGCINVHGSLLPKYRGAAPIQWAVLNGETETGVTTMRMDAGLDTGDMLLSCCRPIPSDMTAGELYDALAQDGAMLLSRTLRELEAGSLRAVPQSAEGATYAPLLDKSLSPLDWLKPASILHNQVRGLHPWPIATMTMGGRRIKVHRSRVGDNTAVEPGVIVKTNPFTVSCGDHTSLELLEIQAEGAKRMPAADYFRGHPVKMGETVLTEPVR